MDLIHISQNTWKLDYPTLVGVYIFDDGSCLLFDSGPGEIWSRRTLKILVQKNLKLFALMTSHSHADHCGGHQYLQQSTGCEIWSSRQEKAFLENPELHPFCLYSASPLKALKNRYLLAPSCSVSRIVSPGPISVKDKLFHIVPLAGHSPGQLGIITPDEVFFAGDALISFENLKNFPFLYLSNIDDQLKTLAWLEEGDFPAVYLSHGGYEENVKGLIKQNRQILETMLQYILSVLEIRPSNREQIVQQVVRHFKLPINRTQYYLISASISACLSYLCNHRWARAYTWEGQMLFEA
ncbi:MBL fold metallo-hydrolase [Syntrophomonas erecta]